MDRHIYIVLSTHHTRRHWTHKQRRNKSYPRHSNCCVAIPTALTVSLSFESRCKWRWVGRTWIEVTIINGLNKNGIGYTACQSLYPPLLHSCFDQKAVFQVVQVGKWKLFWKQIQPAGDDFWWFYCWKRKRIQLYWKVSLIGCNNTKYLQSNYWLKYQWIVFIQVNKPGKFRWKPNNTYLDKAAEKTKITTN